MYRAEPAKALRQTQMFMIYFRMMISFVRLGPSDAALLSKVGGITIFESHGHSAPPT
jgi:hypothetical protein